MGFNRLVATLLVFDAYFRMTELVALSLSITQYAIAIISVIDKVWKYIASQQVNNTLNTCNKPYTVFIHNLPINLPVLVYQERKASQLGE